MTERPSRNCAYCRDVMLRDHVSPGGGLQWASLVDGSIRCRGRDGVGHHVPDEQNVPRRPTGDEHALYRADDFVRSLTPEDWGWLLKVGIFGSGIVWVAWRILFG